MERKLFSTIVIFLVFFGFLEVSFTKPLMATDFSKNEEQIYTKEELRKEAEIKDQNNSEMSKLINSIPSNELIIDSSLFDEQIEKIDNYDSLNVDDKKLFDKYIDDVMFDFTEKAIMNENLWNLPKKIETKRYNIYQKENNIILELVETGTKVYLFEESYIDTLVPVNKFSVRGSWKYKYTRYRNYTGHYKVVSIISAAGGVIGIYVPTIGVVSAALGIYSIGSYVRTSLYEKEVHYYMNDCRTKGKKVRYIYKNSNYTDRLKTVTSYYGDAYRCY